MNMFATDMGGPTPAALLLLAPILCYLLGSIPFGLILCKVIKGVDIREHGSKNIGAANAGRVCGWPFFVATLVLDFAKGFAPLFLLTATEGVHAVYRAKLNYDVFWVLCGVCAILGHTFPIWLRFRGGKAVATGFGVFAALAPIPALIAFGVWLVFFLLFRYVSLASMLGAITAPVAYAVLYWPALGAHAVVFVFTLGVAVLVIIRHRANIQRLFSGTEPRFGRKRE